MWNYESSLQCGSKSLETDMHMPEVAVGEYRYQSKNQNLSQVIFFETVCLLVIISNAITRVSNRANVSRTLLLLQRCIGVLYGLCPLFSSYCTRFWDLMIPGLQTKFNSSWLVMEGLVGRQFFYPTKIRLDIIVQDLLNHGLGWHFRLNTSW